MQLFDTEIVVTLLLLLLKRRWNGILVHRTVLGIEHSLCSPLVQLGETRFLIPDFSEGSSLTTTKATKKEKKTLNNPASFLVFSRQ